eukprot:CAMPEP_0114560618 /NCGR_PEP_ID=MMETSP0114-20121206/11554_1 /TAXON_ID=31324 /ORGANISM="Goniomonas sp, Strain m" /LENGTH=59 /DNA_ID=CAMNT_0001746173 /DNA_START=398 /DNA_END=574 /DNA_ORIENTATION=+
MMMSSHITQGFWRRESRERKEAGELDSDDEEEEELPAAAASSLTTCPLTIRTIGLHNFS